MSWHCGPDSSGDRPENDWIVYSQIHRPGSASIAHGDGYKAGAVYQGNGFAFWHVTKGTVDAVDGSPVDLDAPSRRSGQAITGQVGGAVAKTVYVLDVGGDVPVEVLVWRGHVKRDQALHDDGLA